MQLKHAAATLMLSACALLALPAQAGVLLSNLGSSVDGGYGGNPDSADNFTTGNAGLYITSVDVFWQFGNGGTANQVGFFTDAAGLPSLTQVGSWFTSGTATPSAASVNYVGNATLTANTIYWMVVDILDNSNVGYTFSPVIFSDAATQGASIIPGSAYGDDVTGSWSNDRANLLYTLNGTATSIGKVPEPAIIALMGFGLVAMGFARRKSA